MIDEADVKINIVDDNMGDLQILKTYWPFNNETSAVEVTEKEDDKKSKNEPLELGPYIVLLFTVVTGRITSLFIRVFYFYFAPFAITGLTIMAQVY